MEGKTQTLASHVYRMYVMPVLCEDFFENKKYLYRVFFQGEDDNI